MEVEFIKDIGVYDKMYVTWKYEDEAFDVQYQIHVVDTKLISINDGTLSLEGEFDNHTRIAFIDKETLLKEVAEFKLFGMKLDNNL